MARVIRDENERGGPDEMLATAHPKANEQRHKWLYRQRKHYHLSNVAER